MSMKTGLKLALGMMMLVAVAETAVADEPPENPVITIPNKTDEILVTSDAFHDTMVGNGTVPEGGVVGSFATTASTNATGAATGLVQSNTAECLLVDNVACVNVPSSQIMAIEHAASTLVNDTTIAANTLSDDGNVIVGDVVSTKIAEATAVIHSAEDHIINASFAEAGVVVDAAKATVCDADSFAASRNFSDCGSGTVVADAAALVEAQFDNAKAMIEEINLAGPCGAAQGFVARISGTVAGMIPCGSAPNGGTIVGMAPEDLPGN